MHEQPTSRLGYHPGLELEPRSSSTAQPSRGSREASPRGLSQYPMTHGTTETERTKISQPRPSRRSSDSLARIGPASVSTSDDKGAGMPLCVAFPGLRVLAVASSAATCNKKPQVLLLAVPLFLFCLHQAFFGSLFHCAHTS